MKTKEELKKELKEIELSRKKLFRYYCINFGEEYGYNDFEVLRYREEKVIRELLQYV